MRVFPGFPVAQRVIAASNSIDLPYHLRPLKLGCRALPQPVENEKFAVDVDASFAWDSGIVVQERGACVRRRAFLMDLDDEALLWRQVPPLDFPSVESAATCNGRIYALASGAVHAYDGVAWRRLEELGATCLERLFSVRNRQLVGAFVYGGPRLELRALDPATQSWSRGFGSDHGLEGSCLARDKSRKPMVAAIKDAIVMTRWVSGDGGATKNRFYAWDGSKSAWQGMGGDGDYMIEGVCTQIAPANASEVYVSSLTKGVIDNRFVYKGMVRWQSWEIWWELVNSGHLVCAF